MPIRNYSSKAKPVQSIGDIQGLLAEHGANQVSIDYNGRKPVAVTFVMQVNDVHVPFRLTVDIQGMLHAMKENGRLLLEGNQ